MIDLIDSFHWIKGTSTAARANSTSNAPLLDTIDIKSSSSSNNGLQAKVNTINTTLASQRKYSYPSKDHIPQAVRQKEDESGWTTVARSKKQSQKPVATRTASNEPALTDKANLSATSAAVSGPTGFQATSVDAEQRARALRTEEYRQYVSDAGPSRSTTHPSNSPDRFRTSSSYPLERYPVCTSQATANSYRSTTYQNISASGFSRQEIGDRYVTNHNNTDSRTVNNQITNNNSPDMASGLAGVVIVSAAVGAFAYWVRGKLYYGDVSPSFPMFAKPWAATEFFQPGRVFDKIWSTPPGIKPAFVQQYQDGLPGADGNYVKAEFRRFIVIKSGNGFCSCLSIVSYGSSGASKSRLKTGDHSIVYTGSRAPSPTEEEQARRGEASIRSARIRIAMGDSACQLQAFSRIDYGIVYPIRHDVKVRAFGKVEDSSMAALEHTFRQVQGSDQQKRNPDQRLAPMRSFDGSVHFPLVTERQSGSFGEEGNAIAAALADCGYTQEQATGYFRCSLRRLAERSYPRQQAVSELQEGMKQPANSAESRKPADGKIPAETFKPTVEQRSSPQVAFPSGVAVRQHDLFSAFIKQGYPRERATQICNAVETLQNRGYAQDQALRALRRKLAAQAASQRRASGHCAEEDEKSDKEEEEDEESGNDTDG